MTNEKDWKLIKGCSTPTDASLKQTYIRLSKIFSPVLYFDPDELFFPVDLPSTVNNSALYSFSGEIYEEKETLVKTYGQIAAGDLDNAEKASFTSVVGWNWEKKSIESKPSAELKMPIPKITDIYNKYSTGAIPARLTIYATICKLKDVPNYDFLAQFPPKIGLKVLDEGILLNYYFYFPASNSAELKREGDWSGISILFDRLPSSDGNTLIQQFNQKIGVWVSYYRKMGDFQMSSDIGFRSWNNVQKLKDQTILLETHPKVYISLGRHNCYYDAKVNTTIPVDSPWNPAPDSGKVEEGAYSPSPGGGTLTGGVDMPSYSWLFFVCPPTLLFEACGALDCLDFDSSGLPPADSFDGNDSYKAGGYEGDPESAQTGKKPGSDNYPSAKTKVPVNLKLNVEYIDLNNPTVKAYWKYKGSWGAAEVKDYTYQQYLPSKDEYTTYKSRWGEFGGFERPNLSSWFLWNLFWDKTFGSGGGYGYQSPGP